MSAVAPPSGDGPLDLVDALDADRGYGAVREGKEQALAALDLHPGDTVLDVGCGTGGDVVEMARRVAPRGCAVGVDRNAAILAEARRRAADLDLPVHYHEAAADRLPFADASFDAVHAERVLVHTEAPPAAVAEMARVLRRGGRLLLVEPDYETWVVDSPYPDVWRRINAYRVQHDTSPLVGRSIYGLLKENGLDVAATLGVSLIYDDFEFARRRFSLRQNADGAVAAGLVSADEADRWYESLRAAHEQGRFFLSAGVFAALGVKP